MRVARCGWVLACVWGMCALVASGAAAEPRRRSRPGVRPSDSPPTEAPAVQTPPSAATPDSATTPDSAPSGDEVIDDPELAGSPAAPVADPTSAASAEPTSARPEGVADEARLVLHSRFGLDLVHNDPRDEIWDSTNIARIETTIRPSGALRVVAGLRARYHVSSLAAPVADEGPLRYELDAAVTAGYIDYGFAEGAHLQVGYQPVRLGRFDLVSAIDVLSAYDLRDGLATLPDAYSLGQLALRVDYDPLDWLGLRVLYVPFFTPHVIPLVEGAYGFVHPNQAAVDSAKQLLGDSSRYLVYLSRADRERLAQSGLAALAPEPDLAAQQAAGSVTMHGSVGELTLTLATALEHLPGFYPTPELIAAIGDPSSTDAAARLATIPRPVRVEYGRFGVLGVDGAIDVDPLALGFEVAYSWNRTLYTLGTGNYPAALPLPDHTDVLHFGARLEYVSGTTWLIVLEGFAAYTLREPRDPTRGWLFFAAGRYLAGITTAGTWAPGAGLQLNLGASLLTGPSLLLAPSVSYELFSDLRVELGAVLVEGPAPPMAATPRMALGTLWDATDRIFAGLIYTL